MFLFIFGTFLSLDVYTGDLGGSRLINTVSASNQHQVLFFTSAYIPSLSSHHRNKLLNQIFVRADLCQGRLQFHFKKIKKFSN